MHKVCLGEVAIEHRETCKEKKDDYPTVGLEHLTPEEVTLTAWDKGSDNTFTRIFRKGHILFGRRRAYLKKAVVAPLMAFAPAILPLLKQSLSAFSPSSCRLSFRTTGCLILRSPNPQVPFLPV